MPLWLREYFHKSSIRAPLLYETRRYTNYKLQDNVYVTAFNTLDSMEYQERIDYTRENLKVAPTKEKIQKFQLRWLGRVHG